MNAVDGSLASLPVLRLEPDGVHWLAGQRCERCDAVFAGDRVVCASCGGRDTLRPIRLAQTGILHSYTIVHRSYPGVKTPFVAAVVDLDGGGTLRGTLLEVAPEPAALSGAMNVAVVFRETGQTSKEGKAFLAYYFIPSGAMP